MVSPLLDGFIWFRNKLERWFFRLKMGDNLTWNQHSTWENLKCIEIQRLFYAEGKLLKWYLPTKLLQVTIRLFFPHMILLRFHCPLSSKALYQTAYIIDIYYTKLLYPKDADAAPSRWLWRTYVTWNLNWSASHQDNWQLGPRNHRLLSNF